MTARAGDGILVLEVRDDGYGTGEAAYPNLAEILANSPGELTAASGVPVTVATGDCGVAQALPVANAPCGHTTAGPDTATWDDSPFVAGQPPDHRDRQLQLMTAADNAI